MINELDIEQLRQRVRRSESSIRQLESDIFVAQTEVEDQLVSANPDVQPGVIQDDSSNRVPSHNVLSGWSEVDDHGGLYRIDGQAAELIYYPLMVLGDGTFTDYGTQTAEQMYYRNSTAMYAAQEIPNYLGRSLYVYDEVRADDIRLVNEATNWWNRGDLYVQARVNARMDGTGDGRIYKFAEDSIYASAANEQHLYAVNYANIYCISGPGQVLANGAQTIISNTADVTINGGLGVNINAVTEDIDIIAQTDVLIDSNETVHIGNATNHIYERCDNDIHTWDGAAWDTGQTVTLPVYNDGTPGNVTELVFTKGRLTGYTVA